MSQEIFSKSTIHTKRNLLIASFAAILYSVGIINIRKTPFFGGSIENEALFSISLLFLIFYLGFSTISHIRFNQFNEEKLKAYQNYDNAEDELIRILHSKLNEVLKENIVFKELPFDRFKQELLETHILDHVILDISFAEDYIKEIIPFHKKDELSRNLSDTDYGVNILKLYKPTYLKKHLLPLISIFHTNIKYAKNILKNANGTKMILKNFEIYSSIILSGLAIGSLLIKIKTFID